MNDLLYAKHPLRAAILTLLWAISAPVAAAPVGPRPAVPADLTVWLTGDSADTIVDLSQGPALILMGGGSEVTKTFEERAFPLIPGGNIVVLRTTGSDGYNDYFFSDITTGPNQPSSVETLLVNSRANSDSSYVEWVLAGAEMIWMAGGDQSTYTTNWRGTKVEQGLRNAWARGAIIGGTSAGMAVGGEFIYDPQEQSSLTTANAASDPYHPRLLISDRLFDSPWMDGVITDTHFRNRDRMGRLLGIMAHLREEGRATLIRGVAASESSSLFIDQNGLGTVDLNANGDAVYILQEQPTTVREQVNPGEPLIYKNIQRYRLVDGETFDFSSGLTSVTPIDLSIDGTTPASLYTPADPYIVAGAENPPTPEGFVYAEFFTDATATLAALGFTVEDLSGGNTWSASTQNSRRVARINFNRNTEKNDWLFTPAFPVEAGTEYALEFWFQAGGSGTRDDFSLWVGDYNTAATMVQNGELLASFNGVGTANGPAILSPQTYSTTFTAPTTGTYRIAWHAQSPEDQNDIRLDDITVRSLNIPPLPQQLLSPEDGASTLFPQTYFHLPADSTVTTATVRLATSPFLLDAESSIIGTLANTYFVDPGTLLPGEAYYARLDATNAAGTTQGSVILFSALPQATTTGDLLYTQNLDLPYAHLNLNPGYPQHPKGIQVFDVDAAESATGTPTSWYVDETTLARSAPNALVTRYNPGGEPNDDWLFLPEITTSSTHETLVEFYIRARSNNFPETVELYIAPSSAAIANPNSNQFVRTLDVTSTTYQRIEVALPPNTNSRLALRYTSANQSQVLVDDINITLGEPLPASNINSGWLLLGGS